MKFHEFYVVLNELVIICRFYCVLMWIGKCHPVKFWHVTNAIVPFIIINLVVFKSMVKKQCSFINWCVTVTLVSLSHLFVIAEGIRKVCAK